MTTEAFSEGGLLPAGDYLVAFDKHRITSRFGRGSLELWFRIMDFGPFFEKSVCRYYKVKREGKRSFRAAPQSDFNREFAAVFGRRPPAGLPAVQWYGDDIILKARIETVTKGHDQKTIPEPVRYSVIRSLLERES